TTGCGGVSVSGAAAVAHAARQCAASHRIPQATDGKLSTERGRLTRDGGLERLHAAISVRAIGRHAATCGARSLAGAVPSPSSDGRTVRRARCDAARANESLITQDSEP